MQRRCNLAHLILASVVALVLTPLMVDAAPQAQIAFTSERDGNREIYVMDADGDKPRKLTDSPLVDWDPSWSPDGRHIAFTANGRPGDWGARGGDLEIYMMEANGSNPRKLTNNLRQDTDPAWSPDGKHIAYASTIDRNNEIYVMDVDGGKPRKLTNSGDVHIHNWKPSWSPDGNRIAFSSNRDGNWEIYVMNADGGQQRNCTKDIHGDDPSWSPDGKRIAFSSNRDGNWEIYVINADGRRDPRRLTNNPHDDTDPAWYDPAFAFAVASARKKITIWGWLKQVNR